MGYANILWVFTLLKKKKKKETERERELMKTRFHSSGLTVHSKCQVFSSAMTARDEEVGGGRRFSCQSPPRFGRLKRIFQYSNMHIMEYL